MLKAFLVPRTIALICLVSLVRHSSQSEVDDPENAYQNITSDPNVLIRFLQAQTAHATETDIIPISSGSTMRPPGGKQYRIKRCERANVAKCIRSGEGLKLPKLYQGVYWEDGLLWDEELATAFGEWVEKERRLTIETYMAKNRGAAATSSRRASNGLYWLPSGAGHLNYLALNEVVYVFFFSEDGQKAQIIGTIMLFGVRINVPAWAIDWRMERVPDGSFKRTSFLLGIPTPSANYFLRPILTADLKPAEYFQEWTKARGGQDFFYLDYV